MASGDVKFKVTYSGYNELRAKLRDHEEWMGPPYRTAMRSISEVGATSVRAAAPIGPGRRAYPPGQTVANVRPVVSKAKIPRFARVDETARHGGMAYPRILEFSPYAQSRYKKGTNKHRLWMRNAIQRVVPIFERLLDQAAEGVEKAWAE